MLCHILKNFFFKSLLYKYIKSDCLPNTILAIAKEITTSLLFFLAILRLTVYVKDINFSFAF